MSWWRRYSDISKLCCRNHDGEQNEIIVEDNPLSQTGNSAVRYASERDNIETLALLQSNVAAEV